MSEDARLARLREAIDIGWRQAERGEVGVLDIESILQELDMERGTRA